MLVSLFLSCEKMFSSSSHSSETSKKHVLSHFYFLSVAYLWLSYQHNTFITTFLMQLLRWNLPQFLKTSTDTRTNGGRKRFSSASDALSLCRSSSGQRRRHQPAEVGQNPTGDSGGSLRLLGADQTAAGPAEGRPAHAGRRRRRRRRVRDADGRGERAKVGLIAPSVSGGKRVIRSSSWIILMMSSCR